ncbi:MAG: hypothetical protein JWM31_3335, partial [Solirubrobacterales bacterium]|nr:hypothetical protein [Solirubrobacterales bacterium]
MTLGRRSRSGPMSPPRRPLRLVVACCAGALLLLPGVALAEWTAPQSLSRTADVDPLAQAAFGGSVVSAFFSPTATLSRRAGETFTPPTTLLRAPVAYETFREARLADDGEAIVLSVRRHAPHQRIRATFVAPDGTAGTPVTISDHARSATQPVLDVAPDGTAVAAWAWHDPAG